MKNEMLSFLSSLFATALFAAATISGTPTISQDGHSRRVKISYVLQGDPAIITVDLQTNSLDGAGQNIWTSIGGKPCAGLFGEVNRVIEPGQRDVFWNPEKSWPNQHVNAEGLRAVVKAYPLDSPPNYLVLDLETGVTNWYENAESLPDGGLANDVYRTDRLVMRRIPAAGVTWTMGDAEDEWSHPGNSPQHHVTLSSDYYMGVFELTYGQMLKATGGLYVNRQAFSNEEFKLVRPLTDVRFVELRGADQGVAWPGHTEGLVPHDVDEKINKEFTILQAFRRVTGVRLDLPTEAQWEYAARAGTGTRLYDGHTVTANESSDLAKLGRYKFNGGLVDGTTEPDGLCSTNFGTAVVGSYRPNKWGLYDMYGNVGEWCLDDSPSDTASAYTYIFERGVPVVDPSGYGVGGKVRSIVRGGGYDQSALNCTSPIRSTKIRSSSSAGHQVGARLCWTLSE